MATGREAFPSVPPLSLGRRQKDTTDATPDQEENDIIINAIKIFARAAPASAPACAGGWRRPEKLFAPNARSWTCDAEHDLGEGAYDFVFSRFGPMFFATPVAGLKAMRRALKPGGRMAHIVWRECADNPWLIAARDVGRQFLPPPGPDALSCGPDPFSMATML